MTPPNTLLLIEDNLNLARGLTSNLEYEGYRVLHAPDAATGRQLLAAHSPDLVILDLMLPDSDGYGLLRSLRDVSVDTPVLILTALGEEADKVRGFRFGADDYVTKPFGLMELLARVDALLRRAHRPRPAGASPPSRETVRAFDDVTIDFAARTVTRAGTEIALRPREFDLLAALVRREGRVATRLELLREVWEYDDTVMSRTVDTHVAELRRKLEPDPAHPQYLLTVLKTGYRIKR